MGKQLELKDNEILFISGPANKKQTFGTKGGTLYLTSQRIVFVAHGLNFGSKYDEYYLDQIELKGNTVNIKTSNLGISFYISFVAKTREELGFVVTKKQKDEWIYYITEAVKEYATSRVTVSEGITEVQAVEIKEDIRKKIRVSQCNGCAAFVIVNGVDAVKCDYCGKTIM